MYEGDFMVREGGLVSYGPFLVALATMRYVGSHYLILCKWEGRVTALRTPKRDCGEWALNAVRTCPGACELVHD
jgi:hypothetical protein